MEPVITSAMRVAAEQIAHLTKKANDATKGRLVTLTTGKFEGRTAKIDGVTMQNGRWLFRCWVLRVDGTNRVLTRDPESGAYRPAEDFTVDA